MEDIMTIQDKATGGMLDELLSTGDVSDARAKSLSSGLDTSNQMLLAIAASALADRLVRNEKYRNLPANQLRKEIRLLIKNEAGDGLKSESLKDNISVMVKAGMKLAPDALMSGFEKALDVIVELTAQRMEELQKPENLPASDQ